MLGSISDLNVGSVQWSRWCKYCLVARHHINLKHHHKNTFEQEVPGEAHSEQEVLVNIAVILYKIFQY